MTPRIIMGPSVKFGRVDCNQTLGRHDSSTDDFESYIEKMHKCSAAQWEKKLESKDRDFHRQKLNKSKAGVVSTGSSQGYEPFQFSRRSRYQLVTTRRVPSKSKSSNITDDDTESRRLEDLQSDLVSKSDS